MDREIKFRVWLPKVNKMIYLHDNGFDDNSKSDFAIVIAWEKEEAFILDFEAGNNDDYEDSKILQYTGLKDKNGKEIYEGDILSGVAETPVIVNWNKRFASFCLDRKGWAYSHYFGEACNPENTEVIGNIYENSELIS